MDPGLVHSPPPLDALRKDEYSYGLQMVLKINWLPLGLFGWFVKVLPAFLVRLII